MLDLVSQKFHLAQELDERQKQRAIKMTVSGRAPSLLFASRDECYYGDNAYYIRVFAVFVVVHSLQFVLYENEVHLTSLANAKKSHRL
jgi:hypothetical protein